MHMGRTLFAQLMDYLPWTTFQRILNRYAGNRGVRTFSCAQQFRAMAFAQLTYREGLRDIEVCLSAQPEKLYGMGFGEPVKRSTLADANERRDWHLFCQRQLDLDSERVLSVRCGATGRSDSVEYPDGVLIVLVSS